jgi:hypothetical protein
MDVVGLSGAHRGVPGDRVSDLVVVADDVEAASMNVVTMNRSTSHVSGSPTVKQ